jgi:hypothetical protein
MLVQAQVQNEVASYFDNGAATLQDEISFTAALLPQNDAELLNRLSVISDPNRLGVRLS